MPYGLILILGPTGSGKTTTLYSLLRQMTERDLNVYAIGEHLSYDLEKVIRVDTHKELSVAEALQGALRQHADVILLEEIPDKQTLELALDAALSGHLILSVMQASNLDAALMRHELQGGNKSLMLEALSGVVTQRLTRKLCPNCREAYLPDPAVLQRLGLGAETPLYRPQGCSVCQESGYRGRVGVYETLLVDTEVRKFLKQGGQVSQLHQAGHRSLKDSALEMLSAGLTTPQELLLEGIV
jgi:type II secretory ATPase GspE/PulE/Tfp pilus assembly ATPase PilB-like protein